MGLRDRFRNLIGRSVAESAADRPSLSAATVAAVEKKLEYVFKDESLLRKALVHRSHTHVAGIGRIEANERLEFLGDAVLELVVNEHLYRSYPESEEGDLTKMKSRLVCGKSLSAVAQRLDLGEHILMSRGEAATGGRSRSSILADTVEALIGAVYLDAGLEAARGLISALLLRDADAILESAKLVNHKSRLQEIIQARHKVPPRYRVRAVAGPDHERSFTVEVLFRSRVLGQGAGSNKKAAEQSAAAAALKRLEAEPDLLSGEED